ncbi:uncharacterized protein DUF2796 [Aliiruegeria haliotis]|uniref:Uncharacterized protein DUF2796 n=1 Tax=Aliiruegeria haliotis TaxID=1280846 RepID=A0A2T0RRF6_9RHOB|nr:DUF2796 domain-containing protein [Aliiruegeria haliotis]PRY23722.1 uncharacterized protein DUF2796 [Aliiruegeria haliotis]
MRHTILIPLVIGVTTPAMAESTREMDAHVHGHGTLNIALEGGKVAMELIAPGADIVGFEHAAETDEDKAAVEAALDQLAHPQEMFSFPEAANCALDMAHVEGGPEHGEHAEDHDVHDKDGEHAEDHDDHDKDGEHAEDHDDHDKDGEHTEGHDEDHDDHADHADHDGEAHSEFHAEYTFTCAAPDALTEIRFPYFDLFPNAEELGGQIVSAKGATSMEIERDAPVLDLRGMF